MIIALYIIVAIGLTLVMAAYDNGKRWSIFQYFIIGTFWPISLVLMGIFAITDKLRGK